MTHECSEPHWRLLAAAMAMVGIAMGALFSLGVFLAPIQTTTGWSRTSISAVALLAWVTLGIGSFLWGVLSDRTGPRAVILVGGVLLGLGLVLASQVTALWQFTVVYGVLVGLAVGAFYAPLTSDGQQDLRGEPRARHRARVGGRWVGQLCRRASGPLVDHPVRLADGDARAR